MVYSQKIFPARKQNRGGRDSLTVGGHEPHQQSRSTLAQERHSVEERSAVEQFLHTRTEEDFCALFEAVYPRVRRYFLLRGADAMTADDLAQNVMVTVFRKAGDLRRPELFFGWLFCIAKHELARHWRQQGDEVEFEPLSAELAARLTTETQAARDSWFAVWTARLDPPERELAVLRFVEELSYEDLAVALAVPLGTVKWRLFQLKKKLAQIIRATHPEWVTPRIN